MKSASPCCYVSKRLISQYADEITKLSAPLPTIEESKEELQLPEPEPEVHQAKSLPANVLQKPRAAKGPAKLLPA
jgi:hypothetical protein